MKKFILILVSLISALFCSAQNNNAILLTLKTGTKISCELKSMDSTKTVTVSIAGVESVILMSEIESIEQMVSHSADIERDNRSFPIIPIEETKDNPLKAGNCVYVFTDGPTEYETAAQKLLKQRLEMMGHWIVVDTPEQSHFILQYVTQTSGGRDFSYIALRPRDWFQETPMISPLGVRHYLTAPDTIDSNFPSNVGTGILYFSSSESPDHNRTIANEMAELIALLFANESTSINLKYSWFKAFKKDVDKNGLYTNKYYH